MQVLYFQLKMNIYTSFSSSHCLPPIVFLPSSTFRSIPSCLRHLESNEPVNSSLRFVRSDKQHVVTPNENFTELTGHLAVDEFLCIRKLEVHVGIGGDKKSGVFHAPLQPDGNLFSRQLGQERFWVDWYKLRW